MLCGMKTVNFLKFTDRGLDLDGKRMRGIKLTDICEMQAHYLLLSGITGGNKLKFRTMKRGPRLTITGTHDVNG